MTRRARRREIAGMDSPEKHPNVVLAAGGAWHEPELLRQGYTAQRLGKARRSFRIVSWRDRFGGWHYPRWQFDSELKVLPAVVEILRLFRSSDSLYVMTQFLCPVASDKSFIELIRSGHGDRAVALAKEEVQRTRAEPEMRPEELKELKRRLHESDDPVRYIVTSSLVRGWAMAYDVAQNVYCHEHVSEGCLIKDLRVAQAIAKHLSGASRRNSDLHVLPVRRTKSGFRVLKNIPGRPGEKPWRPRFRTPDDTPVFVPITTPNSREGFVDAMIFAAEHREQIMRLLSNCADREAARQRLAEKCKLPLRQAEAVLEMRLGTMVKTSVDELIDELRHRMGYRARSYGSQRSGRRRVARP